MRGCHRIIRLSFLEVASTCCCQKTLLNESSGSSLSIAMRWSVAIVTKSLCSSSSTFTSDSDLSAAVAIFFFSQLYCLERSRFWCWTAFTWSTSSGNVFYLWKHCNHLLYFVLSQSFYLTICYMHAYGIELNWLEVAMRSCISWLCCCSESRSVAHSLYLSAFDVALMISNRWQLVWRRHEQPNTDTLSICALLETE